MNDLNTSYSDKKRKYNFVGSFAEFKTYIKNSGEFLEVVNAETKKVNQESNN